MKENSREEDIKKVENYLENSAINDTNSNFFKNGGWEIVDLEIPKAMQHILSDYKRVLKENELLRKDIEGWKKYCAEINEEQTKMSNKNCELKFEVEKLQKENEELKFKERSRIIGKYGDVEIHDVINRILSNYYIPVQKVRDKIEYLDNQQKQWLEDRKLKASDSEIIFARDILQKLLESEE